MHENRFVRTFRQKFWSPDEKILLRKGERRTGNSSGSRKKRRILYEIIQKKGKLRSIFQQIVEMWDFYGIIYKEADRRRQPETVSHPEKQRKKSPVTEPFFAHTVQPEKPGDLSKLLFELVV